MIKIFRPLRIAADFVQDSGNIGGIMILVTSIKEMQGLADTARCSNKTIACVPTMGFLHEGHLSLIRYAAEIADFVVTTIFVNPMQFGPNEDFECYPRDTESDLRKACDSGSECIFLPDTKEMYSDDFNTKIVVSGITDKYEGDFRPGHFDGVATVVLKLFNAVKPHIAVFGQKDYQQTLLVKRLVSDLNLDIDIKIRPTVRESDGLAMSSRNIYLAPEYRQKATIIYKALMSAKQLMEKGEGNREAINSVLRNTLQKEPAIKIDYASAVLAADLAEPEYFNDGDEVVLLIAANLQNVRLIDNSIIQKAPVRKILRSDRG
jgi:pantoate--beta-alanine ligase